MQNSLIVSTYNWPEALNLCLSSIKIQSVFPYEVIIADDGSTDETKKFIDEFAKQAPFRIVHVWQEDKGFRAGRIRNKARAVCNCDYIIQIDGDMILHPEFIKDHIKTAKKGFFLRGTRIMLTKEFSDKILFEHKIQFSSWEKGFKNKRFNRIYFPLLGKKMNVFYNYKSSRHVKGCNISFWKEDIININGYNEDFYGWGREDNELAVRLINNGIKKRTTLWNMIAYHIEHQINSRERLKVNTTILHDIMKNKDKWCKKGLDQHLP